MVKYLFCLALGLAAGILAAPRESPRTRVTKRAFTCLTVADNPSPLTAVFAYTYRVDLVRHAGGCTLFCRPQEFGAFTPGKEYVITVEELASP